MRWVLGSIIAVMVFVFAYSVCELLFADRPDAIAIPFEIRLLGSVND